MGESDQASGQLAAGPEEILDLVERVLAPLVAADGGALYVVEAARERVTLHLGGRFSGCPGNTLVARCIIEPLIHRVAPGCAVTVNAGWIIPSGAKRLKPTAA